MSLTIKIKEGERVAVGEAFLSITHAGGELSIRIDGRVKLMRGKDLITIDESSTPHLRIQFALQQMFLIGRIIEFQVMFFEAASNLIESDPSHALAVSRISKLVAADECFKALRLARQLLATEGAEE